MQVPRRRQKKKYIYTRFSPQVTSSRLIPESIPFSDFRSRRSIGCCATWPRRRSSRQQRSRPTRAPRASTTSCACSTAKLPAGRMPGTRLRPRITRWPLVYPVPRLLVQDSHYYRAHSYTDATTRCSSAQVRRKVKKGIRYYYMLDYFFFFISLL